MKKIFFLFILINSFSCKKEWFDYTNKYTGNFEFTNHIWCFQLSTGITSDTTYVYNGTIKRIKRGQIRIKYGSGNNDFLDVEIDKNGKFSDGSFSDSNNLKIYFQTGGHGGGCRFDIVGVRR